jgi:hypothetical protein
MSRGLPHEDNRFGGRSYRSDNSGSRAECAPALSEYIYAVPNGWTTTVSPDGILLRATVLSTGENCLIGLAPPVPSAGDLFADANMAWARSFAGFDVRPTMTFAAGPHIIRGVAAQGWEYVIVKRGVGVVRIQHWWRRLHSVRVHAGR